jgi:hypothetical protein
MTPSEPTFNHEEVNPQQVLGIGLTPFFALFVGGGWTALSVEMLLVELRERGLLAY